MKEKILVTGAKGQLGKKIIELLGNDYDLVLTDTEEMDITDKDKVFEVVGKEKPIAIIHGAAYTRVDDAEEKIDLCRKINAEGSKNVALAAEANNTIMLYISTDFVFDGKKKAPYTEEDETNPLSAYGQTKLEGEDYVREICSKYYILRTAWLFGELPEGHPGTNFVEAMLKLAGEKDSLNIVSDQIGSPTYTGDLVNAIKLLVKSSAPYGIYHISGTGECSWFDFAKEIFEQTNTQIDIKPITSDQYPQKAKRPPYSYLDKSKIEKALDIKIRSWQEMLAEYLNIRLKNG
ncbi:MAG: dTDP-4-dehydrorhamnose reductase [Patescibacteria group bacterium]|nr:dTDP-4-dehydrorhamnose reductase [Patescibacteria group bacterium]